MSEAIYMHDKIEDNYKLFRLYYNNLKYQKLYIIRELINIIFWRRPILIILIFLLIIYSFLFKYPFGFINYLFPILLIFQAAISVYYDYALRKDYEKSVLITLEKIASPNDDKRNMGYQELRNWLKKDYLFDEFILKELRKSL
jgi:hypothetical protein